MHEARRRGGLVTTGLLVAGLLSGCAGGTSSPSPSTAPSPSTSPVPSPSPSATPSSAASPSMASTTFVSAAYGYSVVVPSEATSITPEQAEWAWDGAEQIDSNGPLTDKVWLPDSRFVFVYGGPTTESLLDYATARHLQTAEWHDCPVEPDTATDTTLGGEPARLHSFECQGVHILKLMAVRDGYGLVVNQMAPPRDDAADEAALLDFVETLSWAD